MAAILDQAYLSLSPLQMIRKHRLPLNSLLQIELKLMDLAVALRIFSVFLCHLPTQVLNLVVHLLNSVLVLYSLVTPFEISVSLLSP